LAGLGSDFAIEAKTKLKIDKNKRKKKKLEKNILIKGYLFRYLDR